MQCSYYHQKKCTSCQWIEQDYHDQLSKKQSYLHELLAPFNPKCIYPAVESQQNAFRNKAKMAVLGTVEKPILGILTDDKMVDLCQCPLYTKPMQDLLNNLRDYIRTEQLVPYNLNKRTGELKYIIINESTDATNPQFMLRFVLRSHKFLPKIQASIANLQKKMPQLVVISVNIQPTHMAILEGKEEIILTQQVFLPMPLNNIPLFVQSQSFFQTNSEIAAKLYLTASQWLANLPIKTIWDLFCGVGGFGLHCVSAKQQTVVKLTGIEINPEAIECAMHSAKLMQYSDLTFQSLDATNYAISKTEVPDLVLLNPPRRGAGKELMNYLQCMSPNYILYSSCNLTSLTTDLQEIPNYQIEKVQLFDMFPHTSHMEVLVLCRLKSSLNFSIKCSIEN